jgi:hypothetical protein
VETPKIKEIKGETQKTIKIDGFQRSPPPFNANVLLGRFSLSLTLFVTKLRVLVLSFPDFVDTSTMHNILDSKGHDNLAEGFQGTGGVQVNHKLLNQEVADRHRLFDISKM